MHSLMIPRVKLLALCALGLFASQQAIAQDDGTRESVLISPYTKHYTYSPTHERVWLIGMEQQSPDKSLRGAAFFSNSFGQETIYVFPWGGRYDNVFGMTGVYAKWTAGLMYGYKAPYEDKVPFNYKGFSPAIIPSIGYQISDRWAVEALFLGKAALMLGTSIRYK
jgi:hypothetical protein